MASLYQTSDEEFPKNNKLRRRKQFLQFRSINNNKNKKMKNILLIHMIDLN
jgi:hypothetical protein